MQTGAECAVQQSRQRKRLLKTILIVATLGLMTLMGMRYTRLPTVYAQLAPSPVPTQANDWKDDPVLAGPYATPFSDVNCTPSSDPNGQPDYFCLSSTYLASRGWISGYSNGTFRPWNATTRGQVCKIVVSAKGWPIDTTGGPHFSDVPASDPFYNFIETAYHHNIITGYSDGTFRPGNNVTRAQFTKIIVIAQEWNLQIPSTPHFTDVSTTHTFYAYVETAYYYGIIAGYSDGTFRPDNNILRGQITKMVYKAVEYIRGFVGYDYGHEQQPTPGSDPGRGVHQGSNNYNCTGTNGYRCTSGAAIAPPGYFIGFNYKSQPNFWTYPALVES